MPGRTMEQAIQILAKLMKCDEGQAKLFIQKAPIPLKKTMPLDMANQYKEKLELTGIECMLKAVEPVNTLSLEEEKPLAPANTGLSMVPESTESDSGLGLVGEPTSTSGGFAAGGLSLVSDGSEEKASPQQGVAAMANAAFTCPKCNLQQEKAEQCVSCGIFFHKYEQQRAMAAGNSGAVLATAGGPDVVDDDYDDDDDDEEITPLTSEEVNKLLKNTYGLLGLTLLFSTFTAYLGLNQDPYSYSRIMVFVVSVILMFATFGLRNSVWGLVSIFAFTGWMGYWMGPIIGFYLEMENGGTIITTAAGMTAMAFFGLSAYVLATKRDFSFMENFLFAGLIVCIIGGLLACFSSIPAMMLAVCAIGVLVFCGYILYDTSQLIHGGETNYIVATVSLYLDVINLFLYLMHILGALSGDD